MDARKASQPVRMAGVAPCVLIAVVLSVLSIPCTTNGAGFAHSENFIVFAPEQSLAESVLAKADSFRAQIAEEWLGEELAKGAGRTLVHVELSDTEDSGFTWVMDSPDRTLHNVWLTTTREQTLGSMLGHEITHVVFATRFPDRLPLWIEEGIASFQDDQQRVAARRSVIARYVREGKWPVFERMFDSRTVRTGDQAVYSVAGSVVEYLLSRGDKATLLRFATAAKQEGWNRPLQEYYGLRNVEDLRVAWQAWARRPAQPYVRATSRRSDQLAVVPQHRQ